MRAFDTIFVGGGIFGIAGAWELARRGERVAVIDRLGSGHALTSSTGASRSIRVAYDHPFYVSLALEAISLWRLLEEQSGHRILHLTGQIDLGPEAKLQALRDQVLAAGCEIDWLNAGGLADRFPEMHLLPGESILFHPQAGTVMAEVGLNTLALAAAEAGAEIHEPERVTEIEPTTQGVRVVTNRRVLEASRAVISAGPWSGELLARSGIALPLAPAVAQVTFLDTPDLTDRPGLAEWQAIGENGADGGLYGHPVPGIGYKIAFDAGQSGWDGEVTDWAPDLDEERRLLDWFHARFPEVPAKVVRTQRHPWTMTPDADFIVDAAGGEWDERLILACGCSGHAFKFGPALGRLVAEVIDRGRGPALLRRDRPALGVLANATAPITR